VVEGWVLALVVTGSFTIIGWLVGRMTTQNDVIRTQEKTIDTQDRTIVSLELAGKLQDKLLRLLPAPPGGPHT
jgi:hypothetical protein